MHPAGRLPGVDLARALALVGMVVAHVGAVPPEVDWTHPTTWSAVVNGRASILFAVLAGVSVALTTGRERPASGPGLAAARGRLVVRAVLLVALGVLLTTLGTGVAVILPTYGVLFLLLTPVLRWPRRALLVVAGVAVALSVPVALATGALFAGADAWSAQFGRTYPVVTFLGPVLVGLAVGRSRLARRRTQVLLTVVGSATALVTDTVGAVLAPIDPAVQVTTGVPSPGHATKGVGALLQLVLSPRPHSSSVVDVLGSIGVALAVLGLCLLLVEARPRVTWTLSPLVAAGSMPLSVYALHVVAIAVVARTVGLVPGAPTAWTFVVVIAVSALLWRRWVGQGPLERAFAWLTRSVATAAPR